MKNSGKVINPFPALKITNYKPTPSQEQMLQSCYFAGHSEVFSGCVKSSSSSSDDSELLTGIMMVSVSESSGDYQTPPEHPSRSQNSSNDGNEPTAIDLEVKSGEVGDLEMNATDDDSEPQGDMVVALTNESDDNDSLMVKTNDTEQIEIEDSAENPVHEAFETELMHSPAPMEKEDKVFVQMSERGTEASTSATTTLNRGKRKLPYTIDPKDQSSQDSKGDEAFRGILDHVLSIFGEMPKDDDNIDFIGTAKTKGMTFPHPRWRPPEGFKKWLESRALFVYSCELYKVALLFKSRILRWFVFTHV